MSTDSRARFPKLDTPPVVAPDVEASAPSSTTNAASGDGVAPWDVLGTAPTIDDLVDQHLERVRLYAYRLSGNVHDAADLAQQTFLRAQQKLDQLRQPDQALGWLLAICRNTYFKSRRPTPVTTASNISIDLVQLPQVAARFDRVDADDLQKALRALPVDHRVILSMYYFEDLSYRQIAQQLNIRIGTVMSRLARAKARLRGLLAVQNEDD